MAKDCSITRVLVSDTSVLVNFLRIDRMDLIGDVSYEFFATDHVDDEITQSYAEQQERYQDALAEQVIVQVSLSEMSELDLFGKLSSSGRLGAGECSAIAYAVQRSYGLAIDDNRAAREAARVSGDLTIIRTQDLIVRMIEEELLSVEEADTIKREWELHHRFKLKFDSFAELIAQYGLAVATH